MSSPLLAWLHAHLWLALPIPTHSFAGQTIIITGANTGLGLEAARYFVRLDAAKVILGVRSQAKGQQAVEDIKNSPTAGGVRLPNTALEVWEVDLASAKSVEAFAARARTELDRLDVVVCNAGVYAFGGFELVDGNERTITVNVVNTFLMAMLLLPMLRDTATKYNKEPVLTFTGSFIHFLTSFPERSGGKDRRILRDLADEKQARMQDRYRVSKMIQLLLVRELANALSASSKPGKIITSTVNPGFVNTGLMNEAPARMQVVVAGLKRMTARTPEEGARTMVHAAAGGMDTHGQYLSECKVSEPSAFVRSEEGIEVGKQLWEELGTILEEKHPTVMRNI
ncbi:Protein dhs-3 [Apiospora arundinis]